MILLTFVIVGICVACVIVYRQWTNKYISDAHNNYYGIVVIKLLCTLYRNAKHESNDTGDDHAEGKNHNNYTSLCLQLLVRT